MISRISIVSLTAIILSSFSAGGQVIAVEFIHETPPIPAKAELTQKLSTADAPDAAADLVLSHYLTHGYPAVAVEIDDQNGLRNVDIEVARFDQISLTKGPPRTEKATAHLFQDLSGKFVDQQKLEERLADFHRNPLHRLVPRLQPSSDGSAVNALLRIEQSAAHRFQAGFHNLGASPLPRERFWLQGEWSDFGNRSSLTRARATLAPDPSEFYAVQLGSTLFLKNDRKFGATLAYSGASQSGDIGFDAYTLQAALFWKQKHWQVGLNYRRTNNALEFGNSSARGVADVFQLNAGTFWETQSAKEHLRLSGEIVLGLGGNDEDHDSLRSGAQSRYSIVRSNLWYRRKLSKAWDLVSQLSGQWASDPVLQGDQIALGGAAGLRGLPEQFALGDHGYLAGLTLRHRTIDLSRDWQLRPSFFIQHGRTYDLVAETDTSAITSGFGIQIGLQDLRASLHTGWRLDDGGGSEIHTQLTWTF